MGWIFCSKAIVLYVLFSIIKPCNSDPGCPSGLPDTTLMTSYNDKCYQYVSEEKTWRSARDYCWQYGGSLVILNDEDTNGFVTDTLSSISAWSNNGVWIGLSDNEESDYWKWTTADKDVSMDMTWSNWGGDHPKTGFWSTFEGDCVRMKRSDGWKWHEANCFSFHRLYRFICEYEQSMVTTQEPELIRVGAFIGREREKVFATTNSDDVTSEQTNGQASAGVGMKDLRNYMKYTVVAALLVLGVIIAVLCAIHISRTRSLKRKQKHRPPPSYEESVYEDLPLPDIDTPSVKVNAQRRQAASRQTSQTRDSRQSNVYVEPDMQTTKLYAFGDMSGQTQDAVKEMCDMEGYMEPRSVMELSQLSDTYLTPISSPTEAKMQPIKSLNAEETKDPEIHRYANSDLQKGRKLPDLVENYLPMRGSQKVLVCNETSKSVPSPTSSKEETIDHIYNEI